VPVTGAWSPPDLAVGGLPDPAIGRCSDFSCADDVSDSYAAPARRYRAFSDNKFMSDDGVAGYGIVIARAVEGVGDATTAIAGYLHANAFEPPGDAPTLSWTGWGKPAESRPVFSVIGEGPAPEGLNEAGGSFYRLLKKARDSGLPWLTRWVCCRPNSRASPSR
jgi:hypothetical protein